MYRCYVPAEEGVWLPAVHSNCPHNELAALALRTMAVTPKDPASWSFGVRRRFRMLRKLVKVLNLTPWSIDRVVSSYSGAMRRRYEVAAESLVDDDLGKWDFKLSAFLKGEKINPVLKVSKPRMICPRSPRYNLSIAAYLKPLEHALWKTWKFGHGCRASRISGKGLNGYQRAKLIADKMADVGDCVVFEVDGKAFEAHVSRQQLLLEHSIYKAAYPGDSKLHRLLEVQLKLEGKTAGGIKFEREGCRASGDFNTGMGNTVLMGSFTIEALVSLDLKDPWTILADGDNCLLFVAQNSAARAHSEFGAAMTTVCSHEMTVEKPVTVLEHVTFGQSNPVWTERGYTLVRDPFKVLSGAFSGYRHFHDKSLAPRLIRSIAQGELAMNRGVPLLGPYFERAEYLTRKYKQLRSDELFVDARLFLAVDPGTTLVSDRARLSFASAFGIGVGEQLVIEQRLIAGLNEDLVKVLDGAKWLDSVVEVNHGTVANGGENTADWLFADAVRS